MALFVDPFDALSGLQQALDALRTSSWLGEGPSSSGSFPPVNVFRKSDDFVIITEVPGIKAADIQVQIKGNAIRVSGTKSVSYPEKASLHRRERLSGRFDRTLRLPIEIDADGVKAECRDGILALFLPRTEQDKPRSIKVA